MSSRRGAFTLLEILVTIAIIGVLVSLVLPIARSTVASARGFKCQMSQRSSAYDFNVFADDVYHGDRGRDSANHLRFQLDTFVSSQYCLEEFWCWEGQTRHDLPDNDKNDPLRCPEVKGTISTFRNAPCQGGGVGPWQNVSFGFNFRLKIAERPPPQSGVVTVRLQSAITSESGVPLLWDVDGVAASSRQSPPFFSAPSLGTTGVFGDDRFWFPAMRHNGGLNVGFVDGHVESSGRPLQEAGWRWGFSPVP
ncbi:MAG: prepilin-type N-terminal cleavage/methylation domain-containing protein [Phycisphaerales bacterium]